MLAVALRSFDFWGAAWETRLIAAVVVSLLVAALGAVRGLFAADRWLNLTLGAVCGGLVGLIAAAILFAAQNDLRELVTIACVGSLLIIGLALGIRWQAGRLQR